MRAFAITGTETAFMISSTLVASAMRATPPSARMSAGTRSSAITAHAPASSAILAWSAVVTSMMTPPLSISARPDFTRKVPVSRSTAVLLRTCGRRLECTAGHGPASRRARRSAPFELDRDPAGEELDPGASGRERDLGPVLGDERGHVVERLALPAAADHLAAPQDVRLARTGQVDLGRGV